MAGCSLIPPGLSYQPLQSGAVGAKLQGMEGLGWKSGSERKSGWNPAWENEEQVGSAGEERSKPWICAGILGEVCACFPDHPVGL